MGIFIIEILLKNMLLDGVDLYPIGLSSDGEREGKKILWPPFILTQIDCVVCGLSSIRNLERKNSDSIHDCIFYQYCVSRKFVCTGDNICFF